MCELSVYDTIVLENQRKEKDKINDLFT